MALPRAGQILNRVALGYVKGKTPGGGGNPYTGAPSPALRPNDVTIPGQTPDLDSLIKNNPLYQGRDQQLKAGFQGNIKQQLLSLGILPEGVDPNLLPDQAAVDAANKGGFTLADQIRDRNAATGFEGSGQQGYDTTRAINSFLDYLRSATGQLNTDEYNLGQQVYNTLYSSNPEAYATVPATTAHWDPSSGLYLDENGNYYNQDGSKAKPGSGTPPTPYQSVGAGPGGNLAGYPYGGV